MDPVGHFSHFLNKNLDGIRLIDQSFRKVTSVSKV